MLTAEQIAARNFYCQYCGAMGQQTSARPRKYCDKACSSRHRAALAARPLGERLLAQRCVTQSDCWEWTGARRRFGYGAITIKNRAANVHRVAFVVWNGPIPAGKCVCHTCDNPPCFNPAHLWLGTKGDNNRDSAGKGRSFFGSRMAGERNPQAVLTNAAVSEIRRLKALGIKQRDIAKQFRVREMVISNVICGKTYKESPSC